MGHRSILTILVSIIAFGSGRTAYAGWSEDVRLTYRGQEIRPQVIARGDTVHVVWFQLYGDVSYMRSVDGGDTWDPIVDLTQTGHTGVYANLNLDDNGPLVSWLDDDDSQNLTSIGIATSVDGGTWSEPRYVWTDNPNHFGFPASAVNGDSIFLAYYSHRNDSTGERPIRAMHSYDYGQTWSDEVTVAYPRVAPEQPIRTAYCSGSLVIAWASEADSNHLDQWHVIGSRSSDAGNTWSEVFWISPMRDDWAFDPRLCCNQSNRQFAAAWTDFRNFQYAFHGDMFVALSNDGLSWSFETRASSIPTTWFPAIDLVEDTLLTAWSDMRYQDDSSGEIVFNRSNDGGMTWQGEYRLTYTTDESYAPWISFDSGCISVVWTENPPGSGFDVFYKKYTPDETGINNRENTTPDRISIAAYPIPFNSTLSILIQSPGDGVLAVYDVLGRRIKEFEYKSGSSLILWDATDALGNKVSSGVYFARARGADYEKAVKLIYLR